MSDESLANAYLEECRKLEEIISHIQTKLEEMDNPGSASITHKETARAIRAIRSDNRTLLESALQQPYFGRIDYANCTVKEIKSETLTIYIGANHIEQTNVYSWTAPVARLWYTDGSVYTVPADPRSGRVRTATHISVRIDLKRLLRIRDQQLIEVQDRYRRRVPEITEVGRSALVDVLSSAGKDDAHLSVIIETIEPSQYEAIANQENPALIVQGAAGSGKSEIGLHRIAYLLSPFNDIDDRRRPTPETTLFIGPSQAFLEYAEDVLPTLNVSGSVQQNTLRDWLQDHRTARLRIRSGIWNELMHRGELEKFNERAESFKGSLAMAEMLEKHVRSLTNRVRRQCRNLPTFSIELDSRHSVDVEPEDIQRSLEAALANSAESPRLNDRRQTFVRLVASSIPARNRYSRRVFGKDAKAQRRTAVRQVSERCAEAWPRFDVRQEYAALLLDSKTVLSTSRNSLSPEDAQAVRESASRMLEEGFQDSDVGALTYLDHLLNGTIQSRYQHIVVDEAQDVSPIEFKLLSLASTNNWFTVLGDTAQRLAPYRGLPRWRALDRVFGRTDTRVQHARLSYRANKHITRFNNRILRLFETNLSAPEPFEREGNRPEYHQHSNIYGMYRCVVDDLERIRSLPNMAGGRIAILARDRRNLNRFQDYCVATGRDDVVLIGQDRYSSSRTVLARIPDARGLEYDAVIVLGVNDSFADTLFNQKLLYLATTRARHYLSIHWSGKMSPILRRISRRGVWNVDRRGR